MLSHAGTEAVRLCTASLALSTEPQEKISMAAVSYKTMSEAKEEWRTAERENCLLYTSPSPRDS